MTTQLSAIGINFEAVPKMAYVGLNCINIWLILKTNSAEVTARVRWWCKVLELLVNSTNKTGTDIFKQAVL